MLLNGHKQSVSERRYLATGLRLLLSVCLLSLVACSKSGPSAGGQTAAQTGGASGGTIRLADQVASEVDYAAIWVAEDQGYYKDEGIKINRLTYANGPEALLHFSNGEVDVLLGGLAPIMQYAARGSDFKMIMSVTKYNAPLLGTGNIHSYRDLNGKKVGSPGLGTVQDAILSYVEDTQHIKFQHMYAKVTDLPLMTQRGEVAAFTTWEPAAAIAIQQAPTLHYVVHKPPLKDAESLEAIVQPQLAKDNPKLVTGFVRATLRGIQYIQTHSKEQVADILAKKMNQAQAKEIAMTAMDSVDVTKPRIDMPSSALILKTSAATGKIPPNLVQNPDAWLNKYIDYSFLDAAEKSLKK